MRKRLFLLFAVIALLPAGLSQGRLALEPCSAYADLNCAVCEWVMAEVDKCPGATREQIAQCLDRSCAFLPYSVRTLCDSFVKTKGPQCVDLLVAKVPPEQICTSVGSCTK